VKGLTKISKIFAFSVPFGKFSSIQHKTPNSVHCRVANSAQNSACAES